MIQPPALTGCVLACVLALGCSSGSPVTASPDASGSDATQSDTPATDAGHDAAAAQPTDAVPTDAVSTDAVSTDAAAPGDAGPSGCTVTGSFLGAPLIVADCVSTVVATPSGTTTDVVIVDFASVCGYVHRDALHGGSKVLDVHFSGAAVTPGTYDTPTGPVSVQFANYDATCGSPSGESASSGTVTITRNDGTGIVGSFDVMLNADHATGTFNAPPCTPGTADGGSSPCE